MKKINFIFIAFFACVFFFTGCKKDDYVVTFNPNGGKGTIVSQNFTPRVSQSLMANPFSYRGYNFSGWNTKTDGTGTTYKDQETIKVSESMVLYAQWKPVSGNFTVTFIANGGFGDMPAQIFEAGVPQALSANAFVCEKYTFVGWNTSANGKGKDFANEQIITATSDMTLYAQWLPRYNTYFVIFDANGGTGTMEKQPFIEGSYQELSANTFTRPDHIFKGWNTKADGSGSFYRDKQQIYLHANLLLYAQWVNPAGGGTPCPGTPTMKDIDGNTYNTVQIGTQCWMRENLKTTKYKTGTAIPIIADNEQWYYNSNAAMCYYNNDVTNAATYGALYNGYAVTENICPAGWHVPNVSEWNLLANELGGADNAGYKMKTSYDWIIDWYGYDGSGSNESGFSALPGGIRTSYEFYNMGGVSVFWSSTENYWGDNEVKYLSIESKRLDGNSASKYYGYSIRCIKD